MSAGCFSWCPLPKRRQSRKPVAILNDKLTDSPLASVHELQDSSVKSQAKGTRSDNVSSKQARSALPTTAQYITASGKEVLTLLESAAGVIPVPLLQEAIGVALKIIEVCEEGSTVEKKVKDLQDRVGHLMIVVVDNVTKNEDNGDDADIKVAKHIEHDIQALLSTLGTIKKDLTEISEQNRWVMAFYRDLNSNTLETCMNRISTALEKFKLAHDLRDTDLLQELHNRLGKMSNKVSDVSRDMQNVVDKVDNIDHKLDEFHVLLRKSKRSATLLPSSGMARQQMPLKPEVFYGRDLLVEEIAQLLMIDETSRVCILGPGGMGKTSVSLAVVGSPMIQEYYSSKPPVWVPCIGATSAAAFLEILSVQLEVSGDKQQATLDKIISELDTSKEPRLLVLDNFETPWNVPPATQKLVGDILRRIAQLRHVAMLVTMRGSYPPCDSAIEWQTKKIQPADEKACFHIFHKINPSSKSDPDVGRLLSSLGYMPFAVTLMAKLGKEVHWMAKDLLDAWLECGPDMFSDNLEQSMNRSISLSVDSDLVTQNPNAVLLLSILSLLPAGTTSKNLRWWAPTLKKSMIPAAVAILSKAALLVENEQEDSDPILFVIPVVQSFMQHGRISDDLKEQVHSSCCQYVLEHACRYDDPTFLVKSKAIADEDTNIRTILFDSPSDQHSRLSNQTLEALIAFCWYRCDTKPNLKDAQHAVKVANNFGVEKYKVMALWCLGKTYHQIAKYRLSYEHLLKAYPLFDSFPSDPDMQRFGCQCGYDLADAARFVLPRDEVVELAKNVERKCATLSNGFIHGRSLMFVGVALQEAERRQEALEYLERARIILEEVGNPSPLAHTYQVIARTLYYEKRLPEALDAIIKAWKQAELSESSFFQAFISVDYGVILYSLNRDEEAWKHIEIALMKGSHFGDLHSIVLALDYIGYGYLRRGDYQNALNAYEEAVGKWAGTRETKCEAFCKENIDKVKEKLRAPDAVIGFRRPGLDNDDSLFYPPV